MKDHLIVVRRETKNKWERRTPLNPAAVAQLLKSGLNVAVEESPIRIYSNEEYRNAGATLVPSCAEASIVVGIKEPPLDTIKEGQIHLCFSHTIKGQSYNMPMLRAFIERKGTIIDYEPMASDSGARVAAVFSRFAGISGTVEILRVAAEKLSQRGETPSFAGLKQPWEFGRLEKMRAALAAIAPLREKLRILIVGNGNVGQGCISICECLGIPRISPDRLEGAAPSGPWFCVVDAPEITRAKDGRPFDFPTYVKEGTQLFESTFERLLGKFDILLQGAYWDERYPRQLPLALIKNRAKDLPFVIGDVSCDIDGTLQCTVDATSIDAPAFTFDTATMKAVPGVTWAGPTVMAIDNLPCELAADASDEFSKLMVERIPSVASIDLSKPFESCGLSRELQRGTIVYKGRFTPPFEYMQRYLAEPVASAG